MISLLFCAIQFNLLQFQFISISVCLMDISAFAATPTLDSIVICFLIVRTHILISLLFCAIQFNLLQFSSISVCLMDISALAASPTLDSIVICFLIIRTHIWSVCYFVQFNSIFFNFNSFQSQCVWWISLPLPPLLRLIALLYFSWLLGHIFCSVCYFVQFNSIFFNSVQSQCVWWISLPLLPLLRLIVLLYVSWFLEHIFDQFVILCNSIQSSSIQFNLSVFDGYLCLSRLSYAW